MRMQFVRAALVAVGCGSIEGCVSHIGVYGETEVMPYRVSFRRCGLFGGPVYPGHIEVKKTNLRGEGGITVCILDPRSNATPAQLSQWTSGEIPENFDGWP